MTRVAVLVLAVLIVFAARSYGQTIDDTSKQIDKYENSDNVNEDMDIDDRAAADAYGLARPTNQMTKGGKVPAPPPGPITLHLVECFACSDCQKTPANTTSKVCSYTADKEKQNKCVMYVEQYKHMKRPWYIRGCASERGSCAELRRAHSSHTNIVSLLSCEECEGDRCNRNNVSRSLPNFTMAFFVILVTPLLAKYTLQ